MDTILNQKGKDVICIYVAIGQKASTVAAAGQHPAKARRHGLLHRGVRHRQPTAPPCSTSPPTPALPMAEYFMYKGKDVLIVYDDLSKHAVAYRALSLLLRALPGP